MITNKKRKAAWEAGFMAAKSGKDRSSCPLSRGTIYHDDWCDGYDEYVPPDFKAKHQAKKETNSDYAALEAECERLRGERDRQYDENVNRIAAEGAAILRAEALVARLAEVEGDLRKLAEMVGPQWFLERNWFPAALARGGKADG